MKLYTNGCSFTHGHTAPGDPQDPGYLEQKYKNFTYSMLDYKIKSWPYVLSDKFEFVFNHAQQGSGNNKIFRKTLEFLSVLSENELNEWIFVIQFSQSLRMEFSGLNNGVWSSAHIFESDNDVFDYRVCHKALEYTIDYDNRIKFNDHEALVASHFYNFVIDDEYRHFETLKIVSALTSILENKNIKYLITGMISEQYSYDNKLEETCPRETLYNIDKLTPKHNHIQSIEDILRPYVFNDVHDPCYHPNNKGHFIFGEYVLQEMIKREYV